MWGLMLTASGENRISADRQSATDRPRAAITVHDNKLIAENLLIHVLKGRYSCSVGSLLNSRREIGLSMMDLTRTGMVSVRLL